MIYLTNDQLLEMLDKGLFFVRKSRIQAEQVKNEKILVMNSGPNDVVSTINTAETGDWILTTSSGEKYVMDDDSFKSCFISAGGNNYISSKTIRAVQNTTSKRIRIDTGILGMSSFGDKDCWIVQSEHDESLPYILSDETFKSMYEEVF